MAKSSYYNAIISGGFNTESTKVYTWGGDEDNEFVPNERINSFMQSRLLRIDKWDKRDKTNTAVGDYRKFMQDMYAGFGALDPLTGELTVGDLMRYIIENSTIKDVVWKHLVELINCIAELSEIIKTTALENCNALSTTGLDLRGEKLDTLIASPDTLHECVNSIIEFINCTNAEGVPSPEFKPLTAFSEKHPLSERYISCDLSELNTLDEHKHWMGVLVSEEVKLGKYLRKLEKYHNYVIKNTNKLFKKCNLLKEKFSQK